MCLDVLFTFLGQGSAYWAGNYHHINESAPTSLLLEIHPLVALCGVTLYLWAIYQGVKRLRKPWNVVLTCMVFLIHMYGSSTWVGLFLSHVGSLFFPQTLARPTGALMLFRWGGNTFYLLLIGLCAGLLLSRTTLLTAKGRNHELSEKRNT